MTAVVEVSARPALTSERRVERLARWWDRLRHRVGAGRGRPEDAHTLVVTGMTMFHGHLCINYEVAPVGDAARLDLPWREDARGVAVDDHGVVLAPCSSACRHAAGSSRATGMLTVGPLPNPIPRRVHLKFAPLAAAQSADQPMCELDLDLEASGIRLAWIDRT